MLQRVKMDGIEFPFKLYIAENKYDAETARENGIPYIIWRKGMTELIRTLLRPTIEKMFPGINWNKVLGRKKRIKSDVHFVAGNDPKDINKVDTGYDAQDMLEAQHNYDSSIADRKFMKLEEGNYYERYTDIARDSRYCTGGVESSEYDPMIEDRVNVFDYIGDLSSYVDIDALQKLGLLPKFVGDIADCIKVNLNNRVKWTEGYNKKLKVPIGNFKSPADLPNLIILDISNSIPDGIAATMITLIDTLRSQCNAELIITSRHSGYYPIGAELPSPQTIRDYYGRGNEGREFYTIINKYISGREFGHVFSFGDNDSPGRFPYTNQGDDKLDLKPGTKVHHVHHYHTWVSDTRTGYAKWCHELCGDITESYDTTWCSIMDDNYRM